jgi:hypothetical protein
LIIESHTTGGLLADLNKARANGTGGADLVRGQHLLVRSNRTTCLATSEGTEYPN